MSISLIWAVKVKKTEFKERQVLILWNDLNKTCFQILSTVKCRFSCSTVRNGSYSPLEEFHLNFSVHSMDKNICALSLIGD